VASTSALTWSKLV